MMSALGLTTVAMNSSTDQREVVGRVEGLFALADQLELRLAQARGRVIRLTPAFASSSEKWVQTRVESKLAMNPPFLRR